MSDTTVMEREDREQVCQRIVDMLAQDPELGALSSAVMGSALLSIGAHFFSVEVGQAKTGQVLAALALSVGDGDIELIGRRTVN